MSLVNAISDSVSGISAQANALTAVGANIANSSTVGYRAANAQFETVLAQTGVQAPGPNETQGVQAFLRNAVTSQGVISTTSSATDVAIRGNGFFVVSKDQGQTTHLTRAGSFLADGSGNLVNSAGYQLMAYPVSASGTGSTLVPVNVTNTNAISFNADGTITQLNADGTSATNYKVPLATVPSPNNLTTVDGNIFDVSGDSGPMTLATAGTNGAGTLTSHALEQSTADLGTELTNMIQTQRSYEANSKALQASSDLYGMLRSMGAG